MASDERQPGSVSPGNNLLFGAGHIGNCAVLRKQLPERSTKSIDQIKAGERRAGQDHEFGPGQRILERGGGSIDGAVVKGLPDGPRAPAPGSDMPRTGLGTLVQSAGDGTADQTKPDD
jgi:hypothetical protein